MGAVAVGRLQGQQLRPDDHQPRRAARHRHLRQSGLLFPVRQPGVPRHLRQGDVGARSRRVQGGARRGAEEDRRGLRQRLPVPAAERDGGEREAAGLVEERADLRQRPLGDVVEMRVAGARGARADAALPPVGARASQRLPVTQAVAGRGDGLVIERVEAFEPHIAATYLYRAERALAEARASEARWLRGEPIGPLDGVPATVKDNIATKRRPEAGRHGGERHDAGRRPTRRRPRGCAKPARSSSPRRRCPTTACCRPACRAIIRSRAIPGTSTAIPAARRPARARRRRRSTGRCMSAPTSAARSACRPAGAAYSA